jgi:hypothetical protein
MVVKGETPFNAAGNYKTNVLICKYVQNNRNISEKNCVMDRQLDGYEPKHLEGNHPNYVMEFLI